MEMQLLQSFSTPGTYPPTAVFVVSLFMMVVILTLDLLTPLDIYLHVLYVFPLAAIALNCERLIAAFIGIALALVFQLTDFLSQGLPVLPLIVDMLVFFVAATLVVFLARSVRTNYFENVELATTDWLTGLHNRRGFEAIADMEIARQQRYGGTFSLALIDLDHFKALNDSRGHHTGDVALQSLGKILRENTRQSDSIARLGGDEFAILMPNTKTVDCMFYCQQLFFKIRNRLAADSFNITTSIGCTTIEQPPKSVSEILQKVDKAMYAAKKEGRDRVHSC